MRSPSSHGYFSSAAFRPFCRSSSGLPPQSLADRIGERLAVAGRAVEVDEDRCVAGAGVRLRIPAIAPGIGKGRLRPAVHDERHRVAPPRVEVRGPHHVAVHGFVVRAGERELLRLADLQRGERVGIHARQLAQVAAAQRERIQLRRRFQRRHGEHDLALADCERIDVAGSGQHRRLAGLHFDRPHRALAEMIRDCVQRAAVGRERDLVDRAVPVLRQRAALAGLEIQHHDVEAIGLEARRVASRATRACCRRARTRVGHPRPGCPP